MRLTRVTLFFVVLILGLGFFRLGDYLLQDTETQTFQATEEMMVDTAHILASLIETESEDLYAIEDLFAAAKKRTFSANIFKHLKNDVGVDAYLTDMDGWVNFDSAHPERVGENFSMQRDVSLTLNGKYGARSSRTDDNDETSSIMYVGAPVMKDDVIVGCLSVYKSQADVRNFIEMRRHDIISATIYIGVGILVLIVAVFIWLFRPIGQLTEFARAIARGERQPRPEVGMGREVNTLADALSDMREALEGRKYADQYIQTLTHELKSPLAAIQGAAELIDDDMPPDDRDRFLQNIRAQIDRCQRLIHRLLELSAVESQSHLEDLPMINLADTCRRAVADIGVLAETSNVKLISNIPKTFNIAGNERLLRSAISHLLENAIHFTPSGFTVTISLTSDPRYGYFVVTDEGLGIPDFAAERAFERFYSYREDSSTKGNGLGLALVREVAQLHHGTAEIKSLAEGGTLAAIVLPLNP